MITAKLSRKFYERFGEDTANELVDWFNTLDATYRSDLKEVNERSYERFDARLEQHQMDVHFLDRHGCDQYGDDVYAGQAGQLTKGKASASAVETRSPLGYGVSRKPRPPFVRLQGQNPNAQKCRIYADPDTNRTRLPAGFLP
jgi:hypothetical protein